MQVKRIPLAALEIQEISGSAYKANIYQQYLGLATKGHFLSRHIQNNYFEFLWIHILRKCDIPGIIVE